MLEKLLVFLSSIYKIKQFSYLNVYCKIWQFYSVLGFSSANLIFHPTW